MPRNKEMIISEIEKNQGLVCIVKDRSLYCTLPNMGMYKVIPAEEYREMCVKLIEDGKLDIMKDIFNKLAVQLFIRINKIMNANQSDEAYDETSKYNDIIVSSLREIYKSLEDTNSVKTFADNLIKNVRKGDGAREIFDIDFANIQDVLLEDITARAVLEGYQNDDDYEEYEYDIDDLEDEDED